MQLTDTIIETTYSYEESKLVLDSNPDGIMLVVDDSKKNQSAICSELEDAGFPVMHVKSGTIDIKSLNERTRELLMRKQCDKELLTQKHVLEKQIKDKENKFQHLFNSLSDAVFIHDLEGNFLEVNDIACNRYGYSRDEFLQMNKKDIDALEYAKMIGLKIEMVLIKGTALFEIVQRTKTGKKFPVELSSRVIEYEGKTGILSIARDISQRKLSEAELFQERQQKLTILDSLSETVLYLDRNLTIKWANPHAKEIFSSEIIGKQCCEVLHKKTNIPDDCPAKIALETGKKQHLEIKTSEGKYWNIRANPVVDQEKNIVGIVTSILDITELKQTEEDLLQYQRDLEKMVYERTTELEESNQLKDIFLDILHHDLLNPAGVIKGYSHLLARTETDSKKKEEELRIEEQSKKIIEIIDNASKLSKLRSSKDLELQEADLCMFLKKTVDNFKEQLASKNMHVEGELPENCTSLVNPIIEEVFANLISNAIKYSPEGSTIKTSIVSSENNWEVRITDSGEGIPDSEKENVFHRFERINKGSVKGIGLGLAIVKRIVELHGGDVGVRDNPEGKGSEFWFHLSKA
ncbi:PAS domain S-box-containing protein [Methanohalophilus levihalophilus]|nr:PAS domain S-box-containing protein [Methanohalophilus levihalophilus]